MLKYNRFECNIKNKFFGKTKMEYMGFWVTRKGIKPVNKRVESMVNMTPTNTIKKVRMFVGLVHYYRDMWVKRSHILQHLTSIASTKVTFKWTDDKKKVFDKIKRIVARDTLLIYPYFNKRFDIHIDASDFN